MRKGRDKDDSGALNLAGEAFDCLLTVPVCVRGRRAAAAAVGALRWRVQLAAMDRVVTSSTSTCKTHTRSLH